MRYRLLLLSLLGLALAPLPALSASASCAAPRLEVVGQEGVKVPALHRGDTVTVTGKGFVDGCHDTGGGEVGGLGCSGGNDARPRVHGLKNVRLHLLHGTQQPTQLELGVEDADDNGRVSWQVTIPADAPTGASYLKSELSEPLPVTVRR